MEDGNNYDQSPPKNLEGPDDKSVFHEERETLKPDLFLKSADPEIADNPFQARCKVHLFFGRWGSHRLRDVWGCRERFMFITFIAADSNN